jgi:hypothetical protein
LELDEFTPLEKPIEFGYLAAADGLGAYPVFRYRGTESIIVHNRKEDEAAAAEGFHDVEDFGSFDVPRNVDYGYDLSRLNPMQLRLYAADIGLDLDPDYSIGECVTMIQDFMRSRPSYQGRMFLIAQEITFDLKGAEDEIKNAVREAGGFMI